MLSGPRARQAARAVGAPLERRLAAIVGRLISEKLTHSGLDDVAAQLASTNAAIDGISRQLAELTSERETLESALERSARHRRSAHST